MNKSKKECKVCIYKDTCTLENPKTCEFKPIESAEKFFAWGEFHPKSEDCMPTLSVRLSDNNDRNIRRICPYCGDEMFTFEQYSMYDSITYYRCLCDGALAELEYKDKLISRHRHDDLGIFEKLENFGNFENKTIEI